MDTSSSWLRFGKVGAFFHAMSDFFLANKLYTGKAEKVDMHQGQRDPESQWLHERTWQWRDDRTAQSKEGRCSNSGSPKP
jgi:hypothetical protein